MRYWPLLFIVSVASCSSPQFTEVLVTKKQVIYSEHVQDSFELYITLPKKYSTTSSHPVVYYLDANLKSGKALRKVINQKELAGDTVETIFIGIGHIGNYRVLRRRDFVTPHIQQGDSLYSDETNYGHAQNFYSFLSYELIPLIERNYGISKKRTLIGHSFGGLFAFYSLFQKEQLFQNYVALSPSLWVNDGNIYHFEKKYRKDSAAIDATLFMRAGSRETINKILGACNSMNDFLNKKPYSNLQIDYKILEGETHNSYVEKSLSEIVNKL